VGNRFCEECGAPLVSGGKFCSTCGSPTNLPTDGSNGKGPDRAEQAAPLLGRVKPALEAFRRGEPVSSGQWPIGVGIAAMGALLLLVASVVVFGDRRGGAGQAVSSGTDTVLTNQTAMLVANGALADKVALPLGRIEIRNPMDPDTSNIPRQRLYGQRVHRDLLAASDAGLVRYNHSDPNIFSGNLNSRNFVQANDPLPSYAQAVGSDRIDASVGERTCAREISLQVVENASSNGRPVIIYQCEVTFTPNDFGLARQRRWENTREYNQTYWSRTSRARFLMEFDPSTNSYSVRLYDLVLAGENWPEAIEQRVALLRTTR